MLHWPMFVHSVEIKTNIWFIEKTNNLMILKMPFEFNNDKWVIIQLIDLTSNGGNFGIKIYLNLYTHLEWLQSFC